ncbi:hypothetical protein [Specibacter cremeus]|uniref:hypothetical protein n=1 Tax=Specibacter cremeus TaxID=1629051 RepID=UPI000F773987|nr:hypothetical protein [Specibacter cremeus]
MSNPINSSPTEPTGPTAPVAAPERPGPRVGGIVWGGIVVVLCVLMIVTRQAGLNLDPGQTAMWLLFGAGAALVAGGVASIVRRR